MNTYFDNILDTVISEVNLINYKIKGLNFLEILKNNIIEKTSFVLQNQNPSTDHFNEIKKEITTENRNIKIFIKYISNTSVITKKLIENDTMFLSFNETSSFDIYENDKNSIKIFLYKNMGLSLSRNTIINAKFNKNVLLVEVQNKDIEQTLTN